MQVKIKDVGNYNLINHCEGKIYEAIKDIHSELIKVNVGIENSIHGWLAFERECLEVVEEKIVKMKVKILNLSAYKTLQEVGDIVEAMQYDGGYICTVKCEYGIDELWFYKESVEVIEDDEMVSNYNVQETQKDEHYNNDNGSLYLFAQQNELNAWEFDIIKRIVRCRKKGQFKEDLEKTKRVIDLYIKEFES